LSIKDSPRAFNSVTLQSNRLVSGWVMLLFARWCCANLRRISILPNGVSPSRVPT